MIEVRHLSKSFVKYEKEKGLWGMIKGFVNAKKVITKAVDDLSFSIAKGEVIGYIGANGAGKSTTIKMLTGILTPSSGEVTVDGVIPYKDRITNARNIGVVFGQRTQLWWDLPLIESFTILKDIYQVSDADYTARMALFNEILHINEFLKSPVRTLSLGQRMRADIAASLLHNPKILYLDEPTIGLDVNAKKNMREAIKKMNASFQTTVILTTHDLDDIEELCQRILIIDAGKLIYDGALSDIKTKYGSDCKVSFVLKEPWKDFVDLAKMMEVDPSSITVTLNDDKLEIGFDKRNLSVATVTATIMKHFEVSDLSIQETDIEAIVARIYRVGHA
jgi:ABC-2 type transport system ATP-binding protein